MSTTNTLRMKFVTELGDKTTVSVGFCKTDLTADAVRGAMDKMIARPVFDAVFTAKAGAEIVQRVVTELF